MTTIQRILVPVDFSTQSRAAIKTAIVFAEALGARVDVAHLWSQPAGHPPGVESTLAQFGASEAGAQMRDYLASLEERGVDVRGRLQLVHDEPSRAIVDLATKEGFDLIVIGTHGRTGMAHMLHGSVAERVVRHAPCPVLTIRMPDEGRARRVTMPIPITDP